jgi:hypothetical protein
MRYILMHPGRNVRPYIAQSRIFYVAGSLAGLAVFSSIALTGKLLEFVATSVHVDALMISVERMLRYIEGLDHEPSQNDVDGKRCAKHGQCNDLHTHRITRAEHGVPYAIMFYRALKLGPRGIEISRPKTNAFQRC